MGFHVGEYTIVPWILWNIHGGIVIFAKQIPSPKRVSGVAFGMSPQLRAGWRAWDSSMWNHVSPGLV